MTTIIPFNPSNLANFTFQPVLDGATYSAVVVWNAYAGRYYLKIFTLQGVLMLMVPLTASADVITASAVTNGTNIMVLPGVNQSIIAQMSVSGPGIPAGTEIQAVVGSSLLLTEAATSSLNPGSFLFDYAINLAQGYFGTPIVFRGSSQQFEIG